MVEDQPTLPLKPRIYSHQTLTQISESLTQEQLQTQALPSTTGHCASRPCFSTQSLSSLVFHSALPVRVQLWEGYTHSNIFSHSIALKLHLFSSLINHTIRKYSPASSYQKLIEACNFSQIQKIKRKTLPIFIPKMQWKNFPGLQTYQLHKWKQDTKFFVCRKTNMEKFTFANKLRI